MLETQETVHLEYLFFSLDNEDKHVIAYFAPADSVDRITFNDFKQALTAAGFGEYQLNEAALKDATAKYSAGESFELAVAEAVDGEFDIRIDTNQLNAYLTCIPAKGGAPVTLEHILEEAKHKKIDTAIDIKAVEEALKEGGENILIASGKAPIDGTDGKFENLIPGAKKRSPRLDENGLVDFRELGEILVVRKGDPLIHRTEASNGEPGLTLSKQVIPAKSGEDVTFASKLDGTQFDATDKNLLISAIDGCPVLLDDGATVEPVYSTKDVDLRTGNIDFLGTVNVTGEISTGMTIKASGDIHINHTVEGITLIAGGDINIKGGIIGRTERSSDKFVPTTITCEGSCNVNFSQNTHITAGNSIFIRDYSMQSELTAEHQIIVGNGHSKGHLIGGTTRAGMQVKAQAIGSPARIKTIVIAGDNKALYENLDALTKARKSATDKLLNVIKLLELAAADPSRLPAETVK
ncbi:MAG: FapA family protein, partial [Nitrosomonas sp.]|nr:FapA family protein [Nitrosomonas sp.]